MTDEARRLERWRLMLGKDGGTGLGVRLDGDTLRMDEVLEALYDGERRGGLGASSPNVARWLGDIRTYFPSSVVQVMQKDAFERLNMTQMLTEPELLQSLVVDVHLVAKLVALNRVIPKRTRETARMVVRRLVAELEQKLRHPMTQAVRASLSRAERTLRPRPNEIDWDRTIRRNLKHYLPERKTIIAETCVGYGHRRSSLRDIILCIDQSGSMARSVVYSSIFGAVLASLRAVRTHFVLFDTEVVDLTPELRDPVDLLFGTQLGGGTDINRAVAYCESLVHEPRKTIMVLITDLYEGGDAHALRGRVNALVQSGVTVICLLALDDSGAPAHEHELASDFVTLGVPTFACTPDLFPSLMAAAIGRQDLAMWAARNDVEAGGRAKNNNHATVGPARFPRL